MKRSIRSVEVFPIEGNEHEVRVKFFSWDMPIAARVVNYKSLSRVIESWLINEVTPPKQGE